MGGMVSKEVTARAAGCMNGSIDLKLRGVCASERHTWPSDPGAAGEADNGSDGGWTARGQSKGDFLIQRCYRAPHCAP